ncbi:MAG: hypothetical protein R2851_03865 [Caldilineaceae bacterium]
MSGNIGSELAEPCYLQSDFRLEARMWIPPWSTNSVAMDAAVRPTAIVASNDLMAISLLRALYSRGIPVPTAGVGHRHGRHCVRRLHHTGVDDLAPAAAPDGALHVRDAARRAIEKSRCPTASR